VLSNTKKSKKPKKKAMECFGKRSCFFLPIDSVIIVVLTSCKGPYTPMATTTNHDAQNGGGALPVCCISFVEMNQKQPKPSS
jgi:hypothetical protein